MSQLKLSLSLLHPRIAPLFEKADHKTVAVWAADCAERVLPLFEEKYPEDSRPRKAIVTCRQWVATDIFHMQDVRKASLDAHSAAKDAKDMRAASSAAHAAGQAAAVPHVKRHALGPALYALIALQAAHPDDDTIVAHEREWQYQHLRALTS